MPITNNRVVEIRTWISIFQPLTASSVSIFTNDVIKPSLKNLWQASHLTSNSENNNVQYSYKQHTVNH